MSDNSMSDNSMPGDVSGHRFAVGDKVICNPAETPPRFHGIVYVIERLARVNAILAPVAGGRGLRIHPSALLPAPTDAGSTASTTAESAAVYAAPLSVGAVVTVASPRWRGGSGLFVVLRDNGERASIARLGGDADRYWPKIPRGWLTPVDRDRLLAAVAPLTGGPVMPANSSLPAPDDAESRRR